MLFLSSADFFNINFFEKFFQEYDQSVKQFGFRSGRHFVEPALFPNCLQKLSTDDTSRQRFKSYLQYDSLIWPVIFYLSLSGI